MKIYSLRLTEPRTRAISYSRIVSTHSNVFAVKLGDMGEANKAGQTIMTLLELRTWAVIFLVIALMIVCALVIARKVYFSTQKYAVIQQRYCIFSWTSHGSNGLRTINSFGFMIVTAISHQGTEESCNFLSGRILLFVSLLAGEMNECVAANSIQLLNGETQLVQNTTYNAGH